MENVKTVPYNLRMPEQLKAKLERRAKAEKRSLNQQLIVMLEHALKNEIPKEKPVVMV